MIGLKLTAGLALAATVAVGALLLERAQHETTQERLAGLQQAMSTAISANERLTAERNSYRAAQRALADALTEADAKARAESARVRRLVAEASAADQARRARPDLPPPAEMTDALRDAARTL